MDSFIVTLAHNYEKLRNKDIIKILWKEILKEERSGDYLDQLIEYSFHLPVDSDAYLQELNEKFVNLNKEELRTIDGHLKAYIITFLYYYTNQYNNQVATKTMLASGLYLKLISLPGIGKIFFEKNMFKIQLVVCVSSIKQTALPECLKIYELKLLKKYCVQEELEIFLLRATANTLTRILMLTCTETVNELKNVRPIPHYCICFLREIILTKENGIRVKCCLESLFGCLRSNINDTVPNIAALLEVIAIFIKDVLQNDLDEDKFQNVLDAFCSVWGQEDFKNYDQAVVIMNLLKPHYYKELIRRMVLYSQSKNHKRYLINVMNLLYAVLKNLPLFSLDKIEVLYSCTLRNVIFHFINKEKKYSEKAVETITNISLLKDNPVLTVIFNEFQCKGKLIDISVEALLLSFNHIVDEKWGISPRNQNLLIILSMFLRYSRNLNAELVQKILQAICKDATASLLKPALMILHELFCVMALKEEDIIAQSVLKIMFKNSMQPDASAVHFSNHIFQSMLKPSVIDGITYSPKYYYNLFLTSEFEYEALFTKCQKQISAKDVENIIRNLNYQEPGGAVLLCCLLDYCSYSEINVLVVYMIENYYELSKHATLGPLCIAFEKILRNRTNNENYFQQFDVVQALIMDSLFEQTIQVPCIKPAFDLVQAIRRVLKLGSNEETLNRLLIVASQRAFRRLHCRELGDDSVFMYLNEICLLLRKPPTDDILTLLELYMDHPQRILAMTTYMPDIYLQLLSLFTTLALMNKKKVPLALKYLKANLNSEIQIIKILSFKLLFSLCQEITHEYEEVISFAFEEMVRADPCLIRICSITLEELIHDDYIKLSSEDFYKFIYSLGCEDLGIFMREILLKRFILSNQNDIAKFYIQTIVYINIYSKLPSYPILSSFYDDLISIKLRVNNPKDIITFLFNALPIKKKFNILTEISSIFEDLLRGQCKVDDHFFNMLNDFFLTFKLMAMSHIGNTMKKQYYNNICKQIEKQIVGYDPSYKKQCYYLEYETEIRRCTLVLLKLLFFENEYLANKIQIPLFDTIMYWIDFVKPEVIHYVHVERGKEYTLYFSKLVQYYKRNKTKFMIPIS